MEEELKELLQNTGDSIANLFEQICAASYADNQGNNIRDAVAALKLADALVAIMAFRNKHLGYKHP